MRKINSTNSLDGKELHRVVLTADATKSLRMMTERLKLENQYISFNSSEFVSYVLVDFYQTYFERDLGVYIAEFFDSESYYQQKIKQARHNESFEESMIEAMSEIKRIKGKRRGLQGRKRKVKDSHNANKYEAV